MTIQTEVQKLSPSALVELFELDLRLWGGEILRFHAGVNALGRDVVWQGQPYVRLPIEAEGFERRGQGALPRPRIRVANIGGLLGAEARAFEDFVGCRLIRKRTFARFLDAVNFPEGNPEADPNQHFSDEIWSVDRKAAENAVSLEFELAASIDLPGVRLPGRQVIPATCTWVYRSAECGYTGNAYFGENDRPTADPHQDRCGKRLSSCKCRFGEYGVLNFGGSPGAGFTRHGLGCALICFRCLLGQPGFDQRLVRHVHPVRAHFDRTQQCHRQPQRDRLRGWLEIRKDRAFRFRPVEIRGAVIVRRFPKGAFFRFRCELWDGFKRLVHKVSALCGSWRGLTSCFSALLRAFPAFQSKPATAEKSISRILLKYTVYASFRPRSAAHPRGRRLSA